MVMHHDEKGKFFTRVISKSPVSAVIQTAQNIIHGTIHVRPDARLKDDINELGEHFLAVTDATIYDLQNVVLYRATFLVLNVDHITWIIPQDELAH